MSHALEARVTTGIVTRKQHFVTENGKSGLRFGDNTLETPETVISLVSTVVPSVTHKLVSPLASAPMNRSSCPSNVKSGLTLADTSSE